MGGPLSGAAYAELTATGALVEVLRSERRGRTDGVFVRRLNMGRCDYGETGSAYGWWYPLSALRDADMSCWRYDAAPNRWTRVDTLT